MMKTPKVENKEYEKVKCDDFVTGIIEEVQYDLEHTFKGFGKKEDGTDEEDRVKAAIRLKFKLDGYEFPHYSRWMTFSMHEKANLFLKYARPLIDGAIPDAEIDFDCLNGMKVKTLWVEGKNGFQAIETIRPQGKKVSASEVKAVPTVDVETDLKPDEEVPF